MAVSCEFCGETKEYVQRQWQPGQENGAVVEKVSGDFVPLQQRHHL